MLKWSASLCLGMALACGGGEPQRGLPPTGRDPIAREIPAIDLGLDAVQGRWEAVVAVVAEDDAEPAVSWARRVDCNGETRFIEIRTVGDSSWEFVAGTANGLLLVPIIRVSADEAGVQHLELDGEPEVALATDEAGHLTATPLFDGFTFAPGAAVAALSPVTDPC